MHIPLSFEDVAVFLVRVQSKLTHMLYQFFPSHVMEVTHVDDESRSIEVMYKTCSYKIPNWNHHEHTTMYMPQKGFYLIRTWNREHYKTESHFLHYSFINKALGIQHISTMSIITDYGIVSRLHNFMTTAIKCGDIFSILIGKKDVTYITHEFIKSISMFDNLTANALDLLIAYLQKTPIPDEPSVITLEDFSLEDRTVTGKEKLM